MGRHIVDDRRLVRPVGPIAVSLFAVATLLWAAVASSAAEPAVVTVRFRDAFSGFAPREVDGEVVWETERVLEVRDSAGAIAVLPRENVDEIRPLDGPVGPITVEEFAARLKTSFPRNTPVRTGDGFVVVGTGGPRFLGQCLTNAGRLRREFAEIWDGPRTTVSEPPYPLAVVTFATDAEMQRFVKAETGHVSSGGRAFFAATTNRVYVRAPRTAAEWPRVTNDVLHELTHQQSFNRGLQTRLSDYPLWISEGVAMLTEAADRRGRPPRAGRLPMNPAPRRQRRPRRRAGRDQAIELKILRVGPDQFRDPGGIHRQPAGPRRTPAAVGRLGQHRDPLADPERIVRQPRL
ncbi:MAG: DUF1570 domain-containing protein, partial [Planctomycetota bacterium]